MGMGVVLTPDMFGKDDGQIQWYGVIATTNMACESWAQEGLGGEGVAQPGLVRCILL